MKLFKKLNQTGVAHVAALAVVVVGLAAVGTYMLVQSHAATCVDYQYGYGGSGTCVKYIQQMLNGISHQYAGTTNSSGAVMTSSQLTVDGQFGTATQSKVKTFQKWIFLTADGVIGPKTWGNSAPTVMTYPSLCGYAHQSAFKNSTYAVERTAFQAASYAGCTNKI